MTVPEAKRKCMTPITEKEVIARLAQYTSHGSLWGLLAFGFIYVYPYLERFDQRDREIAQSQEQVQRRLDDLNKWSASHVMNAHKSAVTISELQLLTDALKAHDPEFNAAGVMQSILLKRFSKEGGMP